LKDTDALFRDMHAHLRDLVDPAHVRLVFPVYRRPGATWALQAREVRERSPTAPELWMHTLLRDRTITTEAFLAFREDPVDGQAQVLAEIREVEGSRAAVLPAEWTYLLRDSRTPVSTVDGSTLIWLDVPRPPVGGVATYLYFHDGRQGRLLDGIE
jgi:hypothetical protein